MSSVISHSHPSLDESVIAAATAALASGGISGGLWRQRAEKQLADWAGVPFARLVGSGFQALQCALLASGFRPGDRVIIPTLTCAAVWHAVKSLEGEPVLVDVGEDLPLLGEALPPSELASFVILPQMLGLVRAVDDLLEAGYRVIEDRAQAQAPLCSGEKRLAVYSFSPTKLQTIGHGGLL